MTSFQVRRENDHERRASSQGKFALALLSLFFSFPFVSASPISDAAVRLNEFWVMGAIAVFCLFVGMGARIPFFTVVGFFVVFVMGFIIQAGSLQIPTGEVFINSTHNIEVYEFWDAGNSHIIGWFVMIAGIFATFFSVFAVFGGGS